MVKIYGLCDKGLLEFFRVSIEDYIKIAKFFNVEWIQYRDKTSSIDEKKENLKKLKKLWDKTLIVNDHIELTQFVDGVHLGQEDLIDLINSFGFSSKYEAINGLRKIIGKKIIGLSTHNENEIKEANLLDIDYIGLGAFRQTNTKDVNNLLGKKLEDLAKLSRHRVAAIGGVRLYDNIKNVDFKVIGTDLIRKWITHS